MKFFHYDLASTLLLKAETETTTSAKDIIDTR